MLLFVALLASATRAQELIGQERWPDGALRSTRYSEGGRTHFITYHENGKVKEVGGFNQGKRDGTWKQYSDTGVLIILASFTNGSGQGVWEFRIGDDKPMGRLVFSNGALARGEQYTAEGTLLAQREYR